MMGRAIQMEKDIDILKKDVQELKAILGMIPRETGATNKTMTKQWLKSTVSGYANYIKAKERTFNKYNRDALAVASWRKDYEGKSGLFSSPRDEYNESSKYFRDMRTIFNVGS